MKMRRLKYYFMKGEKLVERAEENYKQLNTVIGIDKMFKLFDDNYDIIVVLLHKSRKDPQFLIYIQSNLDKLLTKK